MQKKTVKENDKFLELSDISINDLLEKIFNEKINNIEYLGLDKLNKIPEYNFKLSTFKVTLNKRQNDVFIKLISSNKITETIFCYWYYCNEKFKINKNSLNYINKRAKIIEYKQKDNIKRLNIQLLNYNNKIFKKLDIYFIKLNSYLGYNKKFINKEDVLFIGII